MPPKPVPSTPSASGSQLSIRAAAISSNDRPRVGTPINTTARAPINNTPVVAPNTPGNPSNGYTYPTRIGAAMAPNRPIEEAIPVPVARTSVGNTSGVYAYTPA